MTRYAQRRYRNSLAGTRLDSNLGRLVWGGFSGGGGFPAAAVDFPVAAASFGGGGASGGW